MRSSLSLTRTVYKDVFLKDATREAPLQGQRPMQYQIHDETRNKHVMRAIFKLEALTSAQNHHTLFS